MDIKGRFAHLNGAEQVAAKRRTSKVPVAELIDDDFQWDIINYENEVARVETQLTLPDTPLELQKLFIVARSRLSRNLALLSNMSEQAVSHIIDTTFV
jgi:hypothetical protein